MSDNESERRETLADIVAEFRAMPSDIIIDAKADFVFARYANRIEAAWKRERDEIVSAVSELREGMCLHCDLQDQCADGEDGMPTTCNAMAKVNNFINRYKKVEARDECPF